MIPQLIVNDEPSIQDVPLTTETVMEKTASMSMPFIKNEGQADPKVKFYANTFAGTAYLTENDLTYVIPTEDGSFVIKETPHGGDFAPSADAPSETVVNYFKGTEENWHTDVPTYDSVSAGFVWDGVSLSLKAYGNNIEKLFTVFPGTNPDVIKMNFDGVESLSVDESGEMLLHTSVGDITMTAPVAYQHVDGIKKFVPVKYSISSSSYGFVLGDYEKTLPVVIDPLLASTFLGGSDEDTSNAIAIDSSGNVYVTGSTIDHTTDLPVTSGAYDESHNGVIGANADAFVSKFSSDLTSLSASTFLGGGGIDFGLGIAIDSSDNVFVTGYTGPASTDFPVTDGAYDESRWASAEVFVSKFSNDLTSLSASTFLGGSSSEFGYAIAIDSSDNVYVTGLTAKGGVGNLPTTSGAYDESHNGGNDAFVSKFSSDLTSLSASTFLGGSGGDYAGDIAIDSSDNVYVTGTTADGDTDLPVTSGAYNESHNDYIDVFVSKFSFDNTGPTVTITSSSGDCGDSTSSTTLSYTATFSESTSNFVVGDITVTGTANGSSPEASNFAGSGTTYTFDVVQGSSDGTVIVSIAAGVATDAAVNLNTASDSCTFTIETVSPTVTITSSSGDCGDNTSSTTLSYTVTFSESTSNFVVGDITVTGTANGSSPEASNFAGSGTTYTFDVVKGSSDGTVIVSVAAGVATDAAGNDNTASDSCTFTIDTVGPTVTITSSTGDSGGTISSGTVRYTITFSSSVTGFTIGDITVTGTANGGSPAASNFAGSGTTYTFDVVRGSSGGTVTVKIAADVATDSDGNDNTISNTYELTVESLAFSSICSKHTLLGNCGTISINNDVYRIAKNWNNFPATEVLVGDPVTITLSIPKKPTYTKISSASVYTEIFGSPKNYEQSSYIDYSPMNNKITYTSQSQLFQVAGATHRIIQDPDVMNLDRFEVVFTMIFAKPMDTSHIVIETKNSSGFPEIIYLTNALKVSERPIYALTLEEQSKFELTYKPEIESEPDMKREIEPEPKGICGKGTVLKDNMCVPKEWSFFDFFEQLMKLFG